MDESAPPSSVELIIAMDKTRRSKRTRMPKKYHHLEEEDGERTSSGGVTDAQQQLNSPEAGEQTFQDSTKRYRMVLGALLIGLGSLVVVSTLLEKSAGHEARAV